MTLTNISPADMRLARTMLKWSQSDLAKAAGVGVSTVADFESGVRTPISNNLVALRQALEQAGIQFGPDGPTNTFEISLHVMTEATKAELRFQFTAAGTPAVEDVLKTFGARDGDGVVIDAVQVADVSMRSALDALVQRHGTTAPQLKRLKKVVCSLAVGECFLVLPALPESTAEMLKLERFLYKLNRPDAPHADEGVDELFGTLLGYYDLTLPRTDRLTYVGDRTDPRTCRFCGGTAATGATFKKVAHVVPAALGNRQLRSNDECDGCNESFGNETEPALIAMLDVQRAFLGTLARDGRPKLEFSQGKLSNDGNKLNVSSRSVTEDGVGGLVVDLGSRVSVAPNAAYRALVKMALSVIDSKELCHLNKTVHWVRYGTHANEPLPKVVTATVNLPPNPSAQISVYVRKVPHPRLPHVVGEFRLGCYLYVFAVPFSESDHWDLVGFFEDEDFRNVFKHYVAVNRWAHHDWSRTEKGEITPQIRFVRHLPG